MPVVSLAEHKVALQNPDYDLISGPQAAGLLRSRVKQLLELDVPLGVDTETTGLDPHVDQVRLIQVASKDFALMVDLNGWRRAGVRHVSWEQPGLAELKSLLEGATPKILQNAAFDINFLRGEGIALGGPLFDTMIAAKVLNNGTGHKNDLGSIVERNLRVPLDKELQKANWGGELTVEMLHYAARDGIALPRLAPLLQQALRHAEVKEGVYLWDIFRLEMECIRPFALMQWHGFGFDREAAEQLRQKLTAEADELQLAFLSKLDAELRRRHPENEAIWLPRDPDGSFNTREKDSGSIRLGTKRFKGFNARSPKQMAERFEQAGILLPPDSKGQPSLDQNLLAFLRKKYELIDAYMTWKHAVTRVSHVEKLLDSVGIDGRIHSSYKQMGTDTGRVSCNSPNQQQIPRTKDFRSLFVADVDHVLVVADFSQVELRVLAELSGEERMREAYRAERDLHTETACLITGKTADEITKEERTSSKLVNFGLAYGAGPTTLQKQAIAQYGIDLSKDEATELVNGFRAAYPTLKQWQDLEGNKTTKAVFTKLGRRRMLVGFNDKYTTRINTQVQGTAGDIAKRAVALLWRQLRGVPENDAKLIAMVHDEIVMEVRTDLAEEWMQKLSRAMEDAGNSICEHVPIKAEASSGPTWADAK